jgi:hypothetical protein
MPVMPVILFLCIAATPFVAGCASTADLTDKSDNTCEIHGCSMTVQEVKCLPGSSVYHTDYYVALQSQFPHHGREQYSEDHGYFYAKRMRLYVCDACTAAYDRWQSEHEKPQGNQTP